MTVPLDDVNDIRAMDAAGVPRAEIARRLGLSRNTVAKYADMADMSPAAPEPRARASRALGPDDAAWIDAVLEADSGAPRKQRHTAKRIYDRLVAERGYGGSYSTVQRHVREWRAARRAGGGEGYLELEWDPGTAQVDFGNFEADVAGERISLKLLVVSLPHSNARYARACMSQRSECMCEGLSGIFGQVGRAPAALVLDNATEAGRMVRGEVTESHLFSLFRAHYRCASRYCNPYSGNEKGSVENAVGFIRRNLLVPVPSVGTLEELNGMLEAGCARLNAASRCRDGRPVADALTEDLAAMSALPPDPFDAVRWVRARADKRGYVTVDGREYVAGPAWHSRELLVGVRAATVEILADRGRRVALLPRAWGAGGRFETRSRSCRRSWRAPGPSASRPSGATCPRASSRPSTAWTRRGGARRCARYPAPRRYPASRPPAGRRCASSRAAGCRTTRPWTCSPGGSPPAALRPRAAPTSASTTGS